MKKRRIFGAALAVALASCSLAACTNSEKPTDNNPDQQEQDTLSSISISGQKTSFKVGQDFTVGDLVVTANYSVSGAKTLQASEYTVDSDSVDKTKAGTYKIKVSYQGKEKEYEVTYTELQVVSISVEGADNETVEYNGLYSASASVKVYATMDDGSTKDVTEDADFSYIETTVAGEATCTVTYQEKEATYVVTVGQAPILGLNIAKSGKHEFVFGKAFTTEGLEVEAVRQDSSKTALTSEEYEVVIKKEDSLNSDTVTPEQFAATTVKTTYYVYITLKDNPAIEAVRYAVTVDAVSKNIFQAASADELTAGSFEPATSTLYTIGSFATGTKVEFAAASGKKVEIDANSCTFTTEYGDREFAQRIKLGGAAETADITDPTTFGYRFVKVTVAHDARLVVFARSSSKDAKRTLKISNGVDFTEAFVCDGDSDTSNNVFTVDVAAGTYWIYCGKTDTTTGTAAGGLNVYGVDIFEKVYEKDLTYSEFSVDLENAKKDYKTGEALDTTGIVGKLLTQYNLWVDVDLEELTFTDENGQAITTLNEPNTAMTIKVSYSTFSTTYTIAVSPADAVLDKLVVKAEPKVDYYAGDNLDLTALKLTAMTTSASLNAEFVYEDDITTASTKVATKVMNGETVIEDFSKATKGVYKLVITYTEGESVLTKEIDINVFEPIAAAAGSIGIGKTEYNVGDKVVAVGQEIMLTYSNTVEASNKNELEDGDDVTIKLYSDSACTTEVALDTALVAGKYYYKVALDSFVSTETFEITVRDYSQALAKVDSTVWTDLLSSGKLPGGTALATTEKVTITSGTSNLSTGSAASGEACLKFDNSTGDKGLTFAATTSDVVVVIQFNASGSSKTFNIGETSAQYGKNADGLMTVTFTVAAGTSVSIYSNGGGIQFISATVFAA